MFKTILGIIGGLSTSVIIGAFGLSSSTKGTDQQFSTESILSTQYSNVPPSISTEQQQQLINLENLQSDVEILKQKIQDLLSQVSAQGKLIETLKSKLEMAEFRWLNSILELTKKQDRIIWTCLIAGGGILTLYLIYKLVVRKKVSNNEKKKLFETNNPNPKPSSIFFFLNESEFNADVRECILSSLHSYPNIKFERVFDQSQSHFTILNYSNKQRLSNNLPDSTKLYLSIGMNVNSSKWAPNELRLSRDEYGHINWDEIVLEDLLRRVQL